MCRYFPIFLLTRKLLMGKTLEGSLVTRECSFRAAVFVSRWQFKVTVVLAVLRGSPNPWCTSFWSCFLQRKKIKAGEGCFGVSWLLHLQPLPLASRLGLSVPSICFASSTSMLTLTAQCVLVVAQKVLILGHVFQHH